MTALDTLKRHAKVVLVLIALACLASVGGAVFAQHRFGMEPCPWCILQRILFLAIAVVAMLAAAMPGGGLGRLSSVLSSLLVAGLGVAGGAAALYQNLVASKLPSCDMTLADRIISGLGLDAWQPEVFEVRSSCADAAVSLLSVPFELWSFGLFALIVLIALALVRAAFMPEPDYM
jgi:protein dithiol:quinone oxidoreductase